MNLNVRCVFVGAVSLPAADLADAGVEKGTENQGEASVAWRKRLASEQESRTTDSENGGSGKSDMVFVLESLPPLPNKTIKEIEAGRYVDFAEFPIYNTGRKGAEAFPEVPEKDGTTGKDDTRKKGPREVPDVGWWHVCFSLYERVRVGVQPELTKALAEYRVAIAEMARNRRWVGVANYDRKFRMKAAANPNKQWNEVDSVVLMYECPLVSKRSAVGTVWRSQPATGSGGLRKDRRQAGTCFRFNKQNGVYIFGQQCRFVHACASCGGDHPATQCTVKVTGRSHKQETPSQ